MIVGSVDIKITYRIRDYLCNPLLEWLRRLYKILTNQTINPLNLDCLMASL